MKFVTSVLLSLLAMAPVSAFVAPLPSAALSSTVISPSPQLSMIATGEMINGETKKKTREVRVNCAGKKSRNRLVSLLF